MADPEAKPPAAAGAPAEEAPAEPSPEELKRAEEERVREEEERVREEEERVREEEERVREEEELVREEEERIRREEREKKRVEDEQKRRKEDERKRVEAARLRMLTETAGEEVRALKTENVELQRRVCTLQKKRRAVNAEQFILEGQEAYYQARLNGWTEKLEFQRVKDQYDTKIDTLRDKLQEKQSECNARHEGMIHYFWKTARNSEDIVSRQRIPRRTLQALEQEERDTILEMQAVRVRGRQLKSQLAKLEYKLEMKDQLQLDTGNLHAVDYEQLKMENESLNAKIHLKNEALSVLRKKTQCLVHTLTHVREKLQFIVVGCKVDGEALATDDKNLHGARIKLSKIKSSIMAIRRKKMKNSVSVTSPMTLDDMDYQREDIEAEEKRLQATKKRYTELSVKIEESKNKAFSLGVIPKPTKKKGSAKDPPLERGNLRWGIRREVLGQVVVGDMVDQMAEQMAAKSLCLST